jgi:protein O-mannosyl-transferase
MSEHNLQKEEDVTLKGLFLPLTIKKAAIFICLIGYLVFFSGLFNGFIGDDTLQITNNPIIRSLRNLPVFFSGSTFYNGGDVLEGVYYKPIQTTLFSFVYSLSGNNPFTFHLFQISIYIINAYFVYLLLKHFFDNLVAFFLALIFLVHPINSETAFYVSATQDVLFFFFGIISLLILQKYQSHKAFIIAGVCLIFSLLSKEAGILFIFTAALYVYFFKKKYIRLWFGYTLISVIAYLILRISNFGLYRNIGTYTPINRLGLFDRMLNIPEIINFYLKTFIFPIDLSTSWSWIYIHLDVLHFFVPLITDLLFFALIVFVAIILKNKKNKYFKVYIFFGLWFLAGLLSYLQFIPLDETVAERWFYFPIVGLLGVIGAGFQAFGFNFKNKYVLGIIIAIIFIFSLRTIVRGFDYKDDFAISSHDINVSREAYILENNLSIVYFEKGMLNQAKAHAEKSIKIFPTITNYTSLGGIEFRMGNYRAAKEVFRKALLFGDFYSAYYNLAGLTLFYGDPKENIDFLENTVLKKFPKQGPVWADLAILEYTNGSKEKALADVINAKKYGSSELINYLYTAISNNKPLNLTFSNSQIFMPDN